MTNIKFEEGDNIKALRAMREAGEVRSVTDAKGNVAWERRK